MVGATDCRSAGAWFNSGWKSWFIFMTGSDNLMNHPAQRYNTMSPIRTVITTITRKSVNMVAELALWIPDTTERQEDYSTAAKAATATAVALDTKARAAQGTVVQLKSELAQSQQSRTETKVLHAIALKPPNESGINAVMSWMQRLTWKCAELQDGLAESRWTRFRSILQTREQHIRGTQHHRTDRLKTIVAELSWRSSIQLSQMERHSKTQRLSISQPSLLPIKSRRSFPSI